MYIKECKIINFRRKAIEVYKKAKNYQHCARELQLLLPVRHDSSFTLWLQRRALRRDCPHPRHLLLTSSRLATCRRVYRHENMTQSRSGLMGCEGIGESLWEDCACVWQSWEWLTGGWVHPTREWGDADDESWPPACVACTGTPAEINAHEINTVLSDYMSISQYKVDTCLTLYSSVSCHADFPVEKPSDFFCFCCRKSFWFSCWKYPSAALLFHGCACVLKEYKQKRIQTVLINMFPVFPIHCKYWTRI